MRTLMTRTEAWRQRRAARQDGFTLVEVVVASFVIMTTLLAMAPVVSGALARSGCSRQRDAANSLANQLLEEVRSVSYSTVASGADTNDTTFTTDSNVSISGGVYTYTPTGETMPSNSATGTSAPSAPIDPLKSTTTINNTTYTLKTYITNVTGTTGAYRVVGSVSWSGGSCAGVATSVTSQTVIDQPSGITTPCISDTTHPFPAPCQANLDSEVTAGDGYVQITPPTGYAGSAINGIALTNAELQMPALDCTLQVEQVTVNTCKATTSGSLLAVSGSSSQSAGAQAQNCTASTDPSGTATCSNSLSQSQSTLTASGSGNSLSLYSGSSDSGSVASTYSASGSTGCDDLSSVLITNSLPCDSGNVTQSGASLSATSSLTSGGHSLGSATLASIAVEPSATLGFNTRATSSGGTYCATTSGDGCVHAGIQRSLGTVGIGALPAQIATDVGGTWGCSGYLMQLSGYSDKTTSESGVNSASPTASFTGGSTTFKYWNGLTCVSQSITQAGWGTTPPSISVPTATVTDALFSGGVAVVTMTTTVTTAGTSTASTTTGCSATCTGTATSGSPVVADVVYQVTVSGTTIADLDIHLDLGTLAAKTTYTTAPSAS